MNAEFAIGDVVKVSGAWLHRRRNGRGKSLTGYLGVIEEDAVDDDPAADELFLVYFEDIDVEMWLPERALVMVDTAP